MKGKLLTAEELKYIAKTPYTAMDVKKLLDHISALSDKLSAEKAAKFASNKNLHDAWARAEKAEARCEKKDKALRRALDHVGVVSRGDAYSCRVQIEEALSDDKPEKGA